MMMGSQETGQGEGLPGHGGYGPTHWCVRRYGLIYSVTDVAAGFFYFTNCAVSYFQKYLRATAGLARQ